ncbi:MAG TPA: N-acetylmuramic acid 6-phosphate etherase [Candidatus Methylomirabilis sp.]|nr:N-acetylmuramic acid 6-phosphate etherase [Candidatus Methylomirabilis sp.]
MIRYDRLPTERADSRTRDLDRLSPAGIARLMNRADADAVRAVGRASGAIARAVALIVESLSSRGRLVFVGAGTSGRLGVIEAAECPPTFGTPPALVQAVIAGGRRAVFRSAEGAEDRASEGARRLRQRVSAGDVVVGIAASGVTPFVMAALTEARRRGAATVLVTCNPRVPRHAARVLIALDVGPEVLAGSTRLKAGTATKLTLNTLTTAAFVRLGKVYGNRMVDVKPRSAKLRARALRLVGEIGGVGAQDAARLLRQAGGSAKLAIVMARLGVDARRAGRMLRQASGSLRRVLDE